MTDLRAAPVRRQAGTAHLAGCLILPIATNGPASTGVALLMQPEILSRPSFPLRKRLSPID